MSATNFAEGILNVLDRPIRTLGSANDINRWCSNKETLAGFGCQSMDASWSASGGGIGNSVSRAGLNTVPLDSHDSFKDFSSASSHEELTR